MRKRIIAANWKMNKTLQEGKAWMQDFISKKKEIRTDCEIVIAPPFTHLESLVGFSQNANLKISAQNCSYERSGSFTGEISALMLSSMNVEYVILGHSERRKIFAETDEMIASKVAAALENNLKIILCIGETKEQRASNKHLEIVKLQLIKAISAVKKDDRKNIVIAYEPVWAIGTGINATPSQAQEMHVFIRNELSTIFDKQTTLEIRILYGGSCNSKNAKEIFSQPDVDGGLIGGASLNVKEFIEIINATN